MNREWIITIAIAALAANTGLARPSSAEPKRPADGEAGNTTNAESAPATSATAQPGPADSATADRAGTGDGERVIGSVEKASLTEHEVVVREGTLPYRAIAANMLMKDEEGKTKATVFFVAYDLLTKTSEQADGAAADNAPDNTQTAVADENPESRPITFVFNGGPGAAAVWLHLGTAGPKVIKLTEDGFAPPPPYELIDNTGTWLDFTDMVFIDPVGTGYSRPAKGEKGEQFYGVTQDVKWVSEFIRLYLTQYERWSSPKFLAGESYGTTRAAALSDFLGERHGIALNGIVLISSVLDFQTIRFNAGNDLPYVLYLPTYAAIARYHGRLGDSAPPLEDLVREVERWAIDEYLVALARGDALPDEQREQVARRLAKYTGLPPDLIERSNLRISASMFQKEVLGDERRIIGRFDGRVTGFDLSPMGTWPAYDPSLSNYLPVYSATFNDYARRVLEFESLLPYEVLSDKVRPWKFGEDGKGYLNVVDDLRAAMAKNPFLDVMFASGYYDLATPYFATIYTMQHLDLGPLESNFTETRYLGGHMMYHNAAARLELHDDMARFYDRAADDDR